jgi:flavin-dependent dehydrogenase
MTSAAASHANAEGGDPKRRETAGHKPEEHAAAIPSDCDIAIVGAGPAGAATARRLAQAGCPVVLLERSLLDTPHVGESLAPGVQPLLADLGVWPQFLALQPLPSYGTRSVWGGPDAEEHSHLLSPWGCGWHVDRLAFDRMLAEAARMAGATLLCGTTVIRCDESAHGWVLKLLKRSDDGSEQQTFRLRANVVIDATGRAARLAPWVGAQRFLLDHLVSVVAQFNGIDTTREGYVMVETTPDGWWYTAPVPGGGMMVMLMTDSDLCRRGGLASHPTWCGRLQTAAATRARVAGGAPSWGPRVFSAISQRLRRREKRTAWLAVGDAALAVDPISGSGVIRALRSARAGAETALTLLEDRTPHIIEVYEAERDLECTTYLNERALYYGIEQRWRESAFWQRRAAAVVQVASSSP